MKSLIPLKHKRLGHISRLRMERLIKDGILPDLDFSNFDTCVDFIKGKLTTKIRNSKVDRCTEFLGVDHTHICGPFTPPAMGDKNYSSCSLMIIPVMVLSSSFVKSLTLWRLSKLSKQKLSSNKGRRSKWFILIEVVSILVDMIDATFNHFQSTFRNVVLMLNIQCLVLLNRMRLRR